SPNCSAVSGPVNSTIWTAFTARDATTHGAPSRTARSPILVVARLELEESGCPEHIVDFMEGRFEVVHVPELIGPIIAVNPRERGNTGRGDFLGGDVLAEPPRPHLMFRGQVVEMASHFR